ncbi:ferrous-iron efflux pump FieF [Gammaproteobacteria bacterium]
MYGRDFSTFRKGIVIAAAEPGLQTEEITRLKKRATVMSLAIGGLLFFVKVGAWAITDSVSVLTSLMDSVFDNAVGVMNFLAVRQALRPADRFFRFGFGKIEPLAALAESVFLAGVAVMIIVEAINRLGHPYPVTHAGWGIGAMGIVILLTGGLVLYQRHVIRLTGSLVVRADSLHYATDIVTHLGIIASLLLSGMVGAVWVDPIFAVGIAGYLIWNAKGIFGESLGIVLDRELFLQLCGHRFI